MGQLRELRSLTVAAFAAYDNSYRRPYESTLSTASGICYRPWLIATRKKGFRMFRKPQQGYKDSNLEMTESESAALPFGYTPLCLPLFSRDEGYYSLKPDVMQVFFCRLCDIFVSFLCTDGIMPVTDSAGSCGQIVWPPYKHIKETDP